MPYRELYASTDTANHLLLLLLEQQEGLVKVAEQLRDIDEGLDQALAPKEVRSEPDSTAKNRPILRAIHHFLRRMKRP